MPTPASGPNKSYSMDFVHDQLANGLSFQVPTKVDSWSRESVLLETTFRLTSQDVILALDRVAQSCKLLASITVDYGIEFTSLVMDDWAHVNRVSWAFTRPRKPTDNGLCESFNGRFRNEYLNMHEFKTIEEDKRIFEAWRYDYNENRPYGSLGNLTPSEYRKHDQRNALKVAKF